MNSPTDQHLGAAFRDLVAEQPFTPDVSAIEHRARQARRRDRIARGGIGAGVVAVAAVAAVGVASAVPSAPGRPERRRPAARTRRLPAHRPRRPERPMPSSRWRSWPPFWSPTRRRPATPRWWNARRARRASSINVWDLYADDGRYFFSQTKAGLPAQVKENNSQGGGIFAREIAAATYAATADDLDAAALKMAWSPDTTPVPAWLSAQVKDISAGGLQIDNYVWEDSTDALIAGSGNPQVRAGVLRLMSVLPGITVDYGKVDGQPTLTLTAGKAELGTVGTDKANPKVETGPAYQEAITINADTGIPLQDTSGSLGKVTGTVSYVVTRVDLADVAAGKF